MISNNDFQQMAMYKCKWCGKTFSSMRHKCMFNPKMKNCFSCKHCTGFDNFKGQKADPETGWEWEIPPYRAFECKINEAIDNDYQDFDKLYERNWQSNCPYYELKNGYEGKKSYAELFAEESN